MTGGDLTADEVVNLLDLAPHPEGGFYREAYRDRPPGGGRGASTAIYYLLRAGEVSAWHRVLDAAEVWHFYAGGPLLLSISPDGIHTESHRLGPDLAAGERPQAVVPAGAWQAARPLGAWTLAGCTVAPGFELAAFEMAAPGWEPGATK